MSAILNHAIRRQFGATAARNMSGTAAVAGEHSGKCPREALPLGRGPEEPVPQPPCQPSARRLRALGGHHCPGRDVFVVW